MSLSLSTEITASICAASAQPYALNDSFIPPPEIGALWLRQYESRCLVSGLVKRVSFPRKQNTENSVYLILEKALNVQEIVHMRIERVDYEEKETLHVSIEEIDSQNEVSALMSFLPIAPAYSSYAASNNTNTLSIEKPSAMRDKLGSPMPILFHGDRSEQEIKKGYVTLFATWAQTSLRVPLGWYAVESKQNVEESLVFSPDQTVKIVARAAMENSEFQSERDAFARLKHQSVQQTRTRLEKMGFVVGKIEQTDLAGEAFEVRVPKITDKTGKVFSFIRHFSQRATKAERDEYWTKRSQNKPLSPLQLPLAMSLLTPADQFDKYLPLFGRMVQDTGLNWSHEVSLTLPEFAAQIPGAARFVAVADEAASFAKTGNSKAFLTRFPEAFEGAKSQEAAQYLEKFVTPLLKKLPLKIQNSRVNVVSDRDPVVPLLRVSIMRQFAVRKEFPAYVVVMEQTGGKIKLVGISTTDIPEGH